MSGGGGGEPAPGFPLRIKTPPYYLYFIFWLLFFFASVGQSTAKRWTGRETRGWERERGGGGDMQQKGTNETIIWLASAAVSECYSEQCYYRDIHWERL